ncbi:unnamed protein product [Orchesella dallaii]|uniref:Secreted protein n=1 Tax=Orchesella dallaii TaxID=48710 RepID=A0ABP1RGH6_9HEXA
MTFLVTSLALSTLFYFSTASMMEFDLEPTPLAFFRRVGPETRGDCTQGTTTCSVATDLYSSAVEHAALRSQELSMSSIDAAKSKSSIDKSYSSADEAYRSLSAQSSSASEYCAASPTNSWIICVPDKPSPSPERAFQVVPTIGPTAVLKHLEMAESASPASSF